MGMCHQAFQGRLAEIMMLEKPLKIAQNTVQHMISSFQK